MEKFNKRLEKNEQNTSKIEEKVQKGDNKDGFTPKQTAELNDILTLIEKSSNREEHRRNTKMIEELRKNILEIHGRINESMSKKDLFSLPPVPKECKHDKQIESIKEELAKMGKQSEVTESIRLQIQQVEESLKPLKESFLCRSRLIASSVSRVHQF